MQQEGPTLSDATLGTRNESAANDSSFSPLSAFVPPRYTVSLIRIAAGIHPVDFSFFSRSSFSLPDRRGQLFLLLYPSYR